MATTVLECLENAKINCSQAMPPIRMIGIQQLGNAIRMLEQGYPIDIEMDYYLETYGDGLEGLPEYEGGADYGE
jgi:hypothetical protein